MSVNVCQESDRIEYYSISIPLIHSRLGTSRLVDGAGEIVVFILYYSK